MSRHGRIVRVWALSAVAPAFLWSACATVIAANSGVDGKSSRRALAVGDEVIATVPGPRLFDEPKIDSPSRPDSHPRIYRVIETRDSWVKLETGWVQAKQLRALDDAAELFQQSLLGGEKSFELVALATIEAKQGRLDKAVAFLTRGLALEPRDVDLLRMRAFANFELRRMDAVEADAKNALGDKDVPVDLRLDFAKLLVAAGNTHAGELAMQDLVEKHPDHWKTHHDLAELRTVGRDYLSALPHANKAVELAPGSDDALALRATLLARLQRIPEAKRDLNALKSLDSDRYFTTAAHVMVADGDLVAAEQFADQAIAASGGSESSHYDRATVRAGRENYRGAIEDLDVVIRKNPKSHDYLVKRAEFKVEIGRHEEAMADFECALGLNIKSAKAWYGKALIMAQSATSEEKRREALGAALRACELADSSEWRPWALAAIAYAKLGRFDRAVEYQTKALEAAPDFKREANRQVLTAYETKARQAAK